MQIKTKKFIIIKKKQQNQNGLSGLSTVSYVGILILGVIIFGFIKSAITGEDLKEDGKA